MIAPLHVLHASQVAWYNLAAYAEFVGIALPIIALLLQ